MKAEKKVLLIVDDRPENLDLLISFLEKYDFNIIVATSGEDAFKRLDYNKPDIIMLDIMMPGIDGFETCRRLKKHDEHKDIPVIFMSAMDDTVNKVKGLELGAVDYISKPFMQEEVLVRIRNHLHIQDLRKKLENTNSTLEKRVAERTVSLEKNNQSLKEEIIERRQVEKDLQRRVSIASLSADIGSGFTSTDSLQTVLNTCVEACVKYLGVTFSRIWTLDIKENILVLQASAGLYTHLDGLHSRVPVSSFKIGKIAEERKPRLTNKVIDDPMVSDKDWARREGMVSFAGYPLLVDRQLLGVLVMFDRKQFTEKTFEILKSVADGIALGIRRKIGEQELKQSIKQLKITVDGIVDALALTVEHRDPYTAGHQQRVSKLACAIADEIGFSKDRIDGVRVAGIVHDIGKIRIPTEILTRPGKLTDTEFTIVRTHAQVSYDILKGIEFPWPIADIVHQHHESMDGSGYPLGISNGDILLEARILCVADTVEAMASHRPYRPALGMDRALEAISKDKAVRFDADVVDACIKLIKEKGFEFDTPTGRNVEIFDIRSG